jgi:hypothetical protein
MPPAYVKPHVKRHKNDAVAEAICEAVTRATMRFVETETPEQQRCLMLHRTRHLFIRQQTAVINAIRAHLAEFGIVAPVGRGRRRDILSVMVRRTCVAAATGPIGPQRTRLPERRNGRSHRADGYAYTSPVGSFAPNGFGLYDVHGNAWQWLGDCWHQNYQGAPSDGSAWVFGACTYRVLRGGSWGYEPRHLRAAFRRRFTADSRNDSNGFRLGRTL